jgi:hypothetical protein
MKLFDTMNWFWRKARAYSLDADAIAMFWFLLQHCNEAEWEKNPFELRIVDIITPLQISEDCFQKARQALMDAKVIHATHQLGRGKPYIFHLLCFPVQNGCEALYNILYPITQNSPETLPNLHSFSSEENPNQKGGEKGELKGGKKGELKGELKGVKNTPFSQDFSPPFSQGFSTPFSAPLLDEETAENGGFDEMIPSQKTSEFSPQKQGGNKEKEEEEDKLLPLHAHVREEQTSIAATSQPLRTVNRPTSLAEVQAYAEHLRTMAGKAFATSLLAEKFWEYYQHTNPPWHIVPKNGTPYPVSNWQKQFRDWEMNERGSASRKPAYSLNVNDIPTLLRGIGNFNDVWSDYLDQCTQNDRPHDRTSALYALDYLTERLKAGDKPLEILQTAIRNQRKEFWNGTKNTYGSRSEAASRPSGKNNGNNRGKPKPITNTGSEPPEESIEIS